jgi:hypothetical protein
MVFRTSDIELIIAIIPLVGFWFLDGYFLLNERRYRKLHDDIIDDPEASQRQRFDMDASEYLATKKAYLRATIISAVGAFYSSMALAVGVYSVIILY